MGHVGIWQAVDGLAYEKVPEDSEEGIVEPVWWMWIVVHELCPVRERVQDQLR